MNIFLLSLAIIVAAGVLPLLSHRHMVISKWFYLGITLIGCVTGILALFFAPAKLQGMTWAWSWLHSFRLEFAWNSPAIRSVSSF